jgi:hypothetical protein
MHAEGPLRNTEKKPFKMPPKTHSCNFIKHILMDSLAGLQELNAFTTWSHNLDTRIKTDFHKIEPELKRLGLDAWHGIEWCFKDDVCRDAVEKYGEKAV